MTRVGSIDLKKTWQCLALSIAAQPVKFAAHSYILYLTLPMFFGTKFESGYTMAPVYVTTGLWCSTTIFYLCLLPIQICKNKILRTVFPPEVADNLELRRRKAIQRRSSTMLGARTILQRTSGTLVSSVKSIPINYLGKFIILGLASYMVPQIFINTSFKLLAEYALLLVAVDLVFNLIQSAMIPTDFQRNPTKLPTGEDLSGSDGSSAAQSWGEIVQELQDESAINFARHDLTIEMEPSATAFIGRGKAVQETGNAIIAIEDFDRAISLDATLPQAYEARATAYLAIGLKALARTDLLKAAQLFGEQNELEEREKVMEALRDLGAQSSPHAGKGLKYLFPSLSIIFKRDITTATKTVTALQLETAKKDLNENIKTYAVYFRMAEAQYQKGDYAAALEACNQALELNSEKSECYRLRAKLHVFRQDINAALRDYDRAIAINDKDADALEERARIKLILGDNQSVADDCTYALTFSKSNQFRLMRAQAQIGMQNYEEALIDLNSFIGFMNRCIVVWDGMKLPICRSIADGLRTQLLEAYELRSTAYSQTGNLDKAAHDAIAMQKLRERAEKVNKKHRKSLPT